MSGQTIQVLGATDQTLSPAATPKLLMDATGAVVTTSGTGTASSQVQGNVAAGAADAGNPLGVGYQVQTTPIATAGGNGTRAAQQGNGFGAAYVTQLAPTGIVMAFQGTNADGVAASSTVSRQSVAAYGYIFNGTTFDRARGDTTGSYCVAAPSAGTDRSITATTTSQQLMAANTSRHGYYVKNDSAVVVWINNGATASATAGGGNIAIAIGGYYESPASVTPSSVVNIIAASATAAVTCREF